VGGLPIDAAARAVGVSDADARSHLVSAMDGLRVSLADLLALASTADTGSQPAAGRLA
jgi:hypothetical protein